MIKTLIFFSLLPSIASAQRPAAGSGVFEQVVFWIGAIAVMVLVARAVFKEQLHERRTLRRLIDEIAPFFPEFEIDRLKRWVHQCVPHIWRLYDTHDLSAIEDFVTEEFKAGYHDLGPKQLGPRGEKLIFEKVLKVHPLGLYMVEDTQPPKGIELMLRLEEKVKLFNPVSTGNRKDAKFTQVQTLWTLRHDGKGWRLHRVWEADGDVTDLVERTAVPPVTEWQRKHQ